MDIYDSGVCRKLFDKTHLSKGCWEIRSKYRLDISKPCRPQITYKGKITNAARIITHIFHGLDLNNNNVYACHTCDNSICVNPDHLWAGSPKQNCHDAIKKGRFKFAKSPYGRL